MEELIIFLKKNHKNNEHLNYESSKHSSVIKIINNYQVPYGLPSEKKTRDFFCYFRKKCMYRIVDQAFLHGRSEVDEGSLV